MDESDMSPEKRRKLDELDRMERDQKAREEVNKAKLERDLSDPRVHPDGWESRRPYIRIVPQP